MTEDSHTNETARATAPDDAGPDFGFDPTATFELLADETRFDILAALAQAPYEEFEGSLTFSELWRRTDVDDSGRFNYHLERLVGPFVRDTAEGYELTHLGRICYRLVASELLVSGEGDDATHYCPKDPTTTPADDGPAGESGSEGGAGAGATHADPDAPTDGPGGYTLADDCPNCGSSLVTGFDGDSYGVNCPECGFLGSSGELPRSAVEHHPPEALPAVFDHYMRRSLVLLNEGLCRWCTAPTDTTVEPAHDDRWPLADWVVNRKCPHCGSFARTTLGESVQSHPAVVAFYHDHGVDVTRTPPWRLDLTNGTAPVEVHGEDPWRGTLRVTRGGETLELELDDDAAVVSARRVEGSPSTADSAPGESTTDPSAAPSGDETDRGAGADRPGADSTAGRRGSTD
jgi:rRNA maturation protein Nop10